MAISAAAKTRLSPDGYGAQRNKVSAFAEKSVTVVIQALVATGGWLRAEEITFLRQMGLPARQITALIERVSVEAPAIPIPLAQTVVFPWERLELLAQALEHDQAGLVRDLRHFLRQVNVEREMESFLLLLLLAELE